MTAPRFCPACGAARLAGAQFCGGCGADLGQATAAAAPAAPEPPVAPTAPPPAVPPAQASRRRGAAIAAVALVAVAALVVGVVAVELSAGGAGLPSVPPDSGAVALTSPVPGPPAGLADPSTPAYLAGSGFTPDATRVLTVTVLRLSLEQYRAATGSYPAALAELFPRFAPKGPDGAPMASPPPATDGYTYQATAGTYTLSVRLASGQSYTTANPTRP